MSDVDKTPVDPDEPISGAAKADEAAASAPGERTDECDLDERQDQMLDEGV